MAVTANVQHLRRVEAPETAQRFTRLDWLFLIIITFPVLGTFFPVGTYLAGSVDNVRNAAADGSRDTTVVLAIILVVILGLFAKALPTSLLAIRRNWLLLALIFWAMVTASWAEIPQFSFNRSGRLLIFALYGIYLADLMEPRRALRLLLTAIMISLTLSLLMIVAMPSLATANDFRGLAGTWRGALGHKNSLGTLASIGLLYAIVAWRRRALQPIFCAYLGLISLLLLVLANSVTAVIGTLAILSIIFYLFVIVPIVRDRVMAIVLAAIFALAAGLLVYSLGSLLDLFGRDSTLTGRQQVWTFAWMMIQQQPFWGYGHGAWAMPDFSKLVLAVLEWGSPHAHNFWLDLRLQLGLPGLVIGIAVWASVTLNIGYLLVRRPVADFVVPLAIFVLMSLRSYSETIILDPGLTDMFWVAISFAWIAKLAANEKSLRSATRYHRSRRPQPSVSEAESATDGRPV